MEEGDVTTEDSSEKCSIANFEDGKRQPGVKERGQPLKAGKGKEMNSVLERLEGNGAPLTL